MAFSSRFTSFLTVSAVLAGPAAFAQSSPGYFIPPSQQSPAPAPPAASPAPSPAPQPASPQAMQAQGQQPAIPTLPPLPQMASPPAAIIGVLSVPEIMRDSTAAQGVQQIIQGREAALNKDEQAAAAAIQAQEASEHGVPSEALRDKIAALQTKFAERNQAIRNSGQAALGQIEAELIAIIKQEAQARGMNLVLQRDQVALNINGFDITDAVAQQLNTLLPSVDVPPSIVTPGMKIDAPDQGDDQGGQ